MSVNQKVMWKRLWRVGAAAAVALLAVLVVCAAAQADVARKSVGGMKLVGPTLAGSPAPTSAGVTAKAAVTLVSSDFEAGTSGWTLVGSPTWGRTTYRAQAGSYAAYCAQNPVAAPGPYTNNMDNWMTAGPFDLSDATSASLTYDTWFALAANDEFLVGFSTDGDLFHLMGWSGQTSGGWYHDTNDLGSFGGSSYLGLSQVWVAFQFSSDASGTAEGAYIDNVRLTRQTPAPTVVVGTSPDYPPYESLNKNGAIVGFDVDLVKAIGARAGFAIEWRSDGFGELLIPGLQDPANYDMVASALTPTADRDAYVDFSDTYIDERPYGPVAFAFPTGSALRGAVNTALQQVKDDGTQAKLFKRWFKPKITKLRPTAAKRNQTVTIIGSEFGAKRGRSYVVFGAKRCTEYVSWSAAKIKCRVPNKAQFGRFKVRVTTTVGTSNAKPFSVKR